MTKNTAQSSQENTAYANNYSCLFNFFVTACGAPQIKESTLPQTSRVGVVSLPGNELLFEKRGVTIFSNKTERIDVTDWHVDEFVVTRLHDNLKNRFEMVPVDPGKYDFSGGFSKNIFYEDVFDPEKMANQIKAISAEYELDALIIVKTSFAEDPYADTSTDTVFCIEKFSGLPR